MSDFPSLIGKSTLWKEIVEVSKKGIIPHAVALVMPKDMHVDCARMIAEKILCQNLDGDDGCPSCRSWIAGGHPDFIVSGEPDSVLKIDHCREICAELCLKPVLAPRRVAVIWNAEEMSLNAANSLLKITEEPPAHAHILFFMEEARLLPTLRSRVWMLSFSKSESVNSLASPENSQQWCNWFSKVHKVDRNMLGSEVGGLISCLMAKGDYERAAGLEEVRRIAERVHLSSTMLQDLIFLIIKEDIPFERIFDDLW